MNRTSLGGAYRPAVHHSWRWQGNNIAHNKRCTPRCSSANLIQGYAMICHASVWLCLIATFQDDSMTNPKCIKVLGDVLSLSSWQIFCANLCVIAFAFWCFSCTRRKHPVAVGMSSTRLWFIGAECPPSSCCLKTSVTCHNNHRLIGTFSFGAWYNPFCGLASNLGSEARVAICPRLDRWNVLLESWDQLLSFARRPRASTAHSCFSSGPTVSVSTQDITRPQHPTTCCLVVLPSAPQKVAGTLVCLAKGI